MKTITKIIILIVFVITNIFISKAVINEKSEITVSEKMLTNFWYVSPSDKPSAEKKFIVSGMGLTSDIEIVASKCYEISTESGANFENSSKIKLNPKDGTLGATTIYVRLQSNLGRTNFNGSITIKNLDGSATATVECRGLVTAPPHFSDELSTVVETTATSVSVKSNVINNGALPIMNRGVCWGTNENPSYTKNIGKTTDTATLNEITSTIKGLTPETTYYARPYIQVGDKTWNKVYYGDNITFTTRKSKP